MLRRRTLLLATLLAPAARAATPANPLLRAPWAEVLAAARGQTVFWNAWGGDDRTNGFIAWANDRVSERFGFRITHVRLRDTSEAVARVVAEKAAGRNEGGSVDLIWINGPNFLAMKESGLLFGPFLDRLPNAGLIDREGKPATVTDFTVPVDGLAAPWRMAQIVYVYDSDTVRAPPRSIPAMLDWAKANPGRLAHPTVRNFLGATFLKQALFELAPDAEVLAGPATDANFGPTTGPLWAWYEALRPHLWRQGRQFPENGPAQRTLMNDGEIDIMISFNPSEASTAIANGQLPPSVRSYVLERGTIGNASFVAIPYNAAHAAAAMVLADFLLSPEAQAHGQDPRVMGNFTVLALERLAPEDRARFERLPRGAATLTNAELGRPLPEPHPSWMTRIVAEWERRVSR
ncbi:ABC transporter substrate-binding protein [Elioraea rosea]|uniref:ABC transporter substrate-binding protein n=1 Tax=Elioraea rosea TaxID=2492390 RepID=UPI0011843FED|nr:ABC transporter substrate-binding protein [Elioraea rosea]